jgi:cytochrome c553
MKRILVSSRVRSRVRYGVSALAFGLWAAWAIYAQAPQGKDLSWAYPVPDKVQPSADAAKLHQLPGSTLSLTAAQIDDLLNPPDWFPTEHPTPPQIVVHGTPPNALACGSCHLMNGQGHPESASLAGLPAAYIIRQMEYFKSGARKDPARMNGIAKQVTDEEVRQAAEYFSALKPVLWTTVVESDTAPKTRVLRSRMRLPAEGGGMEPLGNRIITLPLDAERIEERDPHTGFTAYAPKGSLKKGEALVKTANAKTIQCAICHGRDLHGIGDVPGIAGMHPIYIVRQLYNFKNGGANGGLDQLMKGVVEKLNDDDILDIAAYVASAPR